MPLPTDPMDRAPQMDREQESWIRDYMGLAQSLALQVWRKAPHALDLDDLRAIAYYGLTMAAWRWRAYCAEKNYDVGAMQYFRPFVVRRVNGALYDAIRSADFASRSLRTRAKALQDAGQDVGASHAELAARTGMSITEVRATIRDLGGRPVSLEAAELDPDGPHDVEASAFTAGVLGAVQAAVAGLDEDQRVVLALYYYRGRQLQQVARDMNITETRASQLHAKAVLAVHQAMVEAASTAEE